VNDLARFVIRRLLAGIAFVFVMALAALVLARLVPGDPTAELQLAHADRAAIAAERARLGVDQPLVTQVAAWVAGLARLDLGTSTQFHQPVAGLLGERLGNTARLAALALVAATVVGLPLGLLTGARPRGWLATVVTPCSVALVSCPPVIGVLALLFLAATTGWLSLAPGSLAVPVIALAAPLAAALERLQSQATQEALTSLDLVAAAARGIPPARLLWVHAARQSLRTVLGVYGLMIGSLFSGSLAVEMMTSWPGVGRLLYDALLGRDLFLVTGCALVGAALIAGGNVAADVLRAVADPRVRASAS
jgi:peptide/nickel transport system permease protein